MKYIIIDMMEKKTYSYVTDIEMGFSLDMILEERERLEIPYKLDSFNFGKVLVIKGGE